MRASDLRRIASQQRISVGFLEKDYAISCLLKALYESRLGDFLVFKGGTALKKVYFPETWRLSHDLDFTSLGGFDAQATKSELQLVFETVVTDYGVSMLFESYHTTPGSVIAVIKFRGPLDFPNTLKLDISLDEKLVLEPEWVRVRTVFPDVPDFRVKVYLLKEILVEKLRSLMQRSRSRDYFDVWKLLSVKQFDLEEVRVLLVEKCRTRGVEFRPELIFDVGKLGEVEAYWVRGLGDLMKEVPVFDVVVSELREWLGSLIKE